MTADRFAAIGSEISRVDADGALLAYKTIVVRSSRSESICAV